MKSRTIIALGVATIIGVFLIIAFAGDRIADKMEQASNSMHSTADQLRGESGAASDEDALRNYAVQYNAKPILLTDFMLDSRHMHYQKIVTAGYYHQLNDSAWLTNEQYTGNFLVNVNISHLPRDERAALLACDECSATIVGVVDTVELERGIVAEKAIVAN